MTQVSEIFCVTSEQEKQDKEFLGKVAVRNEKEAKRIIAKYDLKNSSLHISVEFFEDYTKMTQEFKKYLSKRKEFLDFIAEYL
jgi:hypothetical protein